ncbi:predicted protein [Nematostella vectensis]|uniref:tRNA-dihydrouridine(47) synthase [NAD(P)(+)] n=1 Tax=Nematostella vectensis TaxID=45351 RepID=A7T8A1_NEMVE|nr:predicted protein [Nematostella vectensis]|eukprot:XP_001619894.1 hypothetical protein NEMVEDRAFT_v1g223715 [Nematostella vectensis]
MNLFGEILTKDSEPMLQERGIVTNEKCSHVGLCSKIGLFCSLFVLSFVSFPFAYQVIDIPLTVKIRAGIHDKKYTWNAHKLVGNLRDWGTDMVTIHGRSREQRYTKSADWDYIKLNNKSDMQSYPSSRVGIEAKNYR